MKIYATRKRFEHMRDRIQSPLNVITGVIEKRYVQPLAGKSRVTWTILRPGRAFALP